MAKVGSRWRYLYDGPDRPPYAGTGSVWEFVMFNGGDLVKMCRVGTKRTYVWENPESRPDIWERADDPIDVLIEVVG